MDDLTAFVAARLDEDERYLNSNRHHLWTERPFREVAFKRAIIAQWEHSPVGSPVLTNALYQLAAIWSDHPDYRPEWRP